ncbi:MAG TPA: transcriptional regulator [Lachnospiraceae bacterium]|nr:transcriptional regulator [Lachnospiraceae bacterium]
MPARTEIEQLAADFESCRKILCAIGDENRQHLILEMMKMNKCSGVRVGDITEKTHLSRPAVSHHLQILKEAGILKVRKEGTMNFYYFDRDMISFEKLIAVLQKAVEITSALPDRI